MAAVPMVSCLSNEKKAHEKMIFNYFFVDVAYYIKFLKE